MYLDKKYTVRTIIIKVKVTSFIKKKGTNWGIFVKNF